MNCGVLLPKSKFNEYSVFSRFLTCNAALAAVASSSNTLSPESSDSSPETQLLPGRPPNPAGIVGPRFASSGELA